MCASDLHGTHGIASITLTARYSPGHTVIPSSRVCMRELNLIVLMCGRAHTATMCELPMKSNHQMDGSQTLLYYATETRLQITPTIRTSNVNYTNRARSTFNLECIAKFEVLIKPFQLTSLIIYSFVSLLFALQKIQSYPKVDKVTTRIVWCEV